MLYYRYNEVQTYKLSIRMAFHAKHFVHCNEGNDLKSIFMDLKAPERKIEAVTSSCFATLFKTVCQVMRRTNLWNVVFAFGPISLHIIIPRKITTHTQYSINNETITDMAMNLAASG